MRGLPPRSEYKPRPMLVYIDRVVINMEHVRTIEETEDGDMRVTFLNGSVKVLTGSIEKFSGNGVSVDVINEEYHLRIKISESRHEIYELEGRRDKLQKELNGLAHSVRHKKDERRRLIKECEALKLSQTESAKLRERYAKVMGLDRQGAVSHPLQGGCVSHTAQSSE